MFEAKNITYRYPKGSFVLQPTSVQVARGEVVGIVGQSGSGKTTLSRLLSGLAPPHSGHIMLSGNALSIRRAQHRRQFRRSVQMVFQDPDRSLPKHVPVGIPLHHAAKLTTKDKAERQRNIHHLLRELKLPSDTITRRPRELSGGQRQRVAIARALLVSPTVIILDEPTSALDVSVQNDILNLLQRFRSDKTLAQIMITHDIHIALSFCDRLYVMHQGQVVESGTAWALSNRPKHPATQSLLDAVPSPDPNNKRIISPHFQ